MGTAVKVAAGGRVDGTVMWHSLAESSGWTSRASCRGWGKIMGMSQLHDVSDLAQFACTSLGSVVPERGWGG